MKTAVACTRVILEGPNLATKSSFNISKKALQKWPGHLGECFTTENWQPGMSSQTVQKIQSADQDIAG